MTERSTQPEIELLLSIKFGPSANFPPWATPFMRAIDTLDSLWQVEFERSKGDTEVGSEESIRWYLGRAESLLLSAIELSGEQEALPYTWLASVYMKSEDWSKAREAAFKAVELDPLQSSTVLRLATCYENEKQYIKARDWYERGICLMPSVERHVHHRDKLKRLNDRANDMKANVVRVDPFDILPLEVIIKIMQFGLEEYHSQRDSFVLRSSWVNKTWRQTLVNNCPELWGTFKLPWREFKDKSLNEKREAWIERSGGKFHSMEIGSLFHDMSLTGVGKIPKTYGAYLSTVKNLDLNVTDNKALFRFAKRFAGKGEALQRLSIDGGDIPDAKHRHSYLDNVLHCMIMNSTSDCTIKTMEIQNVDFRERDIPDWRADDHFYGRLRTAPRTHDVYPALTRLVVSECLFDVFEADLDPDADNDTRVDRQMACALHRTLLGAERLQYLKVICDDPARTGYEEGSRRQRMSEKRIAMVDLRKIILPPPMIWAIDIHAPNVKSLDFMLRYSGWCRHEYEARPLAERPPLIPDIRDSPVNIDNLENLTHLGFECSSADTLPRLEEWLSRVPNLVSLSLNGFIHVTPMHFTSAQAPPQNPPRHEDRVDVRILQALIDHPEWTPKLTDLQLSHCETPDDRLMELVNIRQNSTTAAPLSRLSLHGRIRPSRETHIWLHKALPADRDPYGHWSGGFSHTTGSYGSAGEDSCDCHMDTSILDPPRGFVRWRGTPETDESYPEL